VPESPETMPRERSSRIKQIAESLGFAACGICDASPIARRDYVLAWLGAGHHGEMDYLRESIETRLDPAKLQPGCRSVIVVAWLYRVRETEGGLPAAAPTPPPEQAPLDAADPAHPGRIARYAWGRDYHRVMRTRLYKLVDQLRAELPPPFKTRVCVDIWPVLERELAERAGIGWIGRNCMVLNRALGSYFCLATVLTTLDLATDEPMPDGCGTCRRCLDACPTGALFAPHKMDARRCLSYLTVEHRSDIPEQYRGLQGQVFGCDICQEVCPHNGPAAPISIEPDAQPRWPAGQVDCRHVLAWKAPDWDTIMRGRALRRAAYEMWQRNARAVLRLAVINEPEA
jgi:epoxyqueuosine reductase